MLFKMTNIIDKIHLFICANCDEKEEGREEEGNLYTTNALVPI